MRADVATGFRGPQARGYFSRHADVRLGASKAREGLPVPIETALAASAGRMPERAGTERPEGRMPAGSVRRDGTGNPKPRASQACYHTRP